MIFSSGIAGRCSLVKCYQATEPLTSTLFGPNYFD